MREEETGDDEGGQQWGYSAGKGCLFFNLFFEESGCVGGACCFSLPY